MVFIGALLAAVSLSSEAALIDRPMEREGQNIRALFFEGKFEELEAIERRSRDLSITLSDGQSLRAAFFFGIDCSCGTFSPEELFAMLPTLKTRVAEWRKLFPGSTAARFAEAFYYTQHAWAVRGTDYAHKVPESAWPTYRENIEQAAKVLDAMGRSGKDEPHWYAARLSVMRQQSVSRGEYEVLLEEALRRHPRYLPIYFEANTFYSPKWGGSNEETAAFIEKSVERTRPFMGEALYARLHWSNQEKDMFASGQTNWARMKAGFERILAGYPDRWNLSNYGKLACRARDAKATLDVMNRVTPPVVLEAWGDMDYYMQCMKWAWEEGRS